MSRRAKNSLAVPMLAVLAACSSGPVTPPVADATRAAEARAAMERGDFADAQAAYAELVRRSTGDERRRFQLELARAWVGAGNADEALAALGGILPPLPEGLDADIAAVRADALFMQGRAVEAVRLLVEREIWLDSAAEILANQSRIWAGLSLPLNRSAGGFRTGDTVIDGWLALAPMTALTGDEEDFLSALLGWGTNYPNHPAAGGILAEQLALIRGPGTRARRIALLLPLSDLRSVRQGATVSTVRAQALDIRNGFLAAHYASAAGEEVTISVYDTTRRGAVESYQAAQLEGADFIVGPLFAADVGAVRASAGFVPTLALNVSGEEAPVAGNFFRYALTYDDEIEAIATRAIAAGQTNAVVLHASDEFGYRQGNQFRAAFEARGGRVVATAAYVSNGQNLSRAIESVLNIDRSEQRRERLAANLGRTIEFEPRRRQDIDMIFLQAEPADGRLLVPLLNRNSAADVPTYSTRDIYEATRSAGDPDLDRVLFTDVPILIEPTGEARVATELIGQLSSAGTRLDRRLFGFGFDAYLLAEALHRGDPGAWPLAGATGELYLGDNGRIRRRLPFAEFSGGRPRSTGPAIGLIGAR